ncbi:mechanosensitive ion channel family protein [Geodermatophilus sp. YIM 151500]|uniref:mechanosensitive ion channel family protein n=1 Tax=Geodermatophilus sp. YIM 151500 TaxID=2984531 RepID=UPI0021E3F366|nr:mechanosensitive ion channel family protein [Geodermatophilus sp. YIM 151500]MCV2489559.1 mechanosensitive ion channel family protein [Geodermatophilus sp. YIM 151500]
MVEEVVPESPWLLLALLTGVAAAAWLLAAGVGVLVTRLAARAPVVAHLSRRGRRPFRILVVLIALLVVLDSAAGAGDWRDPVVHALGLALIATIAWLVAAGTFVAEDLALARYDVDVVDNRHARRVRTQVSLLRRLTVVVVAVLAGAAMLLTFPAARAAGASILASAGVISIVAGLAAQTSLANVFAGLQLAFTDAIRVDDVVVIEDEWGRIEEITLTYVVVHVWDDRRLVLPSTYFTTTPFQNWTRKESAVLGAVELDVDWTTPFDRMRAELDRLVAASDLWDTRVGVLQVTDAVGSLVRVRVLVSAKDGPTLFDLRCQVREALVVWLRREAPHALPRVRNEGPAGHEVGRAVDGVAAAGHGGTGRGPNGHGRTADARPVAEVPEAPAAGLFTGSSEGRERSRAFTGPSEAELADRDTERDPAR